MNDADLITKANTISSSIGEKTNELNELHEKMNRNAIDEQSFQNQTSEIRKQIENCFLEHQKILQLHSEKERLRSEMNQFLRNAKETKSKMDNTEFDHVIKQTQEKMKSLGSSIDTGEERVDDDTRLRILKAGVKAERHIQKTVNDIKSNKRTRADSEYESKLASDLFHIKRYALFDELIQEYRERTKHTDTTAEIDLNQEGQRAITRAVKNDIEKSELQSMSRTQEMKEEWTRRLEAIRKSYDEHLQNLLREQVQPINVLDSKLIFDRLRDYGRFDNQNIPDDHVAVYSVIQRQMLLMVAKMIDIVKKKTMQMFRFQSHQMSCLLQIRDIIRAKNHLMTMNDLTDEFTDGYSEQFDKCLQDEVFMICNALKRDWDIWQYASRIDLHIEYMKEKKQAKFPMKPSELVLLRLPHTVRQIIRFACPGVAVFVRIRPDIAGHKLYEMSDIHRIYDASRQLNRGHGAYLGQTFRSNIFEVYGDRRVYVPYDINTSRVINYKDSDEPKGVGRDIAYIQRSFQAIIDDNFRFVPSNLFGPFRKLEWKANGRHFLTSDETFEEEVTTVSIIEFIKRSMRNNRNVFLFGFGLSGSGKTTTIFGDSSDDEPGIFRLLQNDSRIRSEDWVEEYWEQYFDLDVSATNEVSAVKPVVFKVENVSSARDFKNHMIAAKTVRATYKNKESSRSQAYVIFKKRDGTGPKVVIMDACGTEDVTQTRRFFEQLYPSDNLMSYSDTDRSTQPLPESNRYIPSYSTRIPTRPKISKPGKGWRGGTASGKKELIKDIYDNATFDEHAIELLWPKEYDEMKSIQPATEIRRVLNNFKKNLDPFVKELYESPLFLS
ncbi:MAG: hypothetical protein ABEI52_03345, partial [Halobacteriaceae archaeon]